MTRNIDLSLDQDLKLDLDLSLDRDLDLDLELGLCLENRPRGASRRAPKPPKMLVGRSWGILERAGRVQEVPRGRQRDP